MPRVPVRSSLVALTIALAGPAAAQAAAESGHPLFAKREAPGGLAPRPLPTPAQRQALLAEFAKATDDQTRSALIADAADHATDFIASALTAPHAPALIPLVTALVPRVPVERAPQLVQACANAPLPATAVKSAVLRGLARLSAAPVYLDAPTSRFLQRLLLSPDTAVAALPLVARWDRVGTLLTGAEPMLRQLQRDLVDRAQTDARRTEIAASLLILPKTRPDVLPRIAESLTDPATSPALQSALIATLGDFPGADVAAVLVETFIRTKSSAAGDQLLRRPDSALALLEAIKIGRLNAADLGPDRTDRLRHHPDSRVAQEAARQLGTTTAPPSPEPATPSPRK